MAILLASVASVGTLGIAYAQTGFTVATDNTEYSTGEDITVSGNVGRTPTGQPLLIQVYNPNGAVYRFDQVTVESDGSYTYTFRVGGNLGVSGEYEVRVSYAGATANTTFDFTSSTTGGWRTATLVIDGADEHDILYQITGGSLTSLTGDSETATITAGITANNAGQLMLQLPRDIVDAIDANGDDLDYIVFVDELETTADDDFGADTRTLTIDFEAGSEQVDIVGTTMIPEFGAIAAIVLAVAIVGIIVATTRYSKFSFLPKM
ncbi:PEFG-CTERM sorting domain-containing protein [Nitrososphaera sp.]|uniref:PEFG-CTERM sorting domain-containing protein n=1 Tax=Nitrososphaera sp. TaxID=1971748 RepID=UPI00182E0DE8|nr:PEFG-CTERM sorting domain-containing protein [Nitrososphaera sp.]NWG37065.1 PEFG-CTERM sorting domain-containing protein [Nitrososphaera sp.]